MTLYLDWWHFSTEYSRCRPLLLSMLQPIKQSVPLHFVRSFVPFVISRFHIGGLGGILGRMTLPHLDGLPDTAASDAKRLGHLVQVFCPQHLHLGGNVLRKLVRPFLLHPRLPGFLARVLPVLLSLFTIFTSKGRTQGTISQILLLLTW